MPKLDRTMTDIYADELYSPGFQTTSVPPSSTPAPTVLPQNDVLSQRLQAANSQHLSVLSAPNTLAIPPREPSPFRPGSPHAPSEKNIGLRSGTANAWALPTQMSSEQTIPKIISPKDVDLPFSPQQQTLCQPLQYRQQPTISQGPLELHSYRNRSSSAYSTSSQVTHHQGNFNESETSERHTYTGTYTCTYQKCTLRFDTVAKLKEHKCDWHESSQAGPYNCERINPSTGKPCNTFFSRPYDLTRHEDTIHNSWKQKEPCPLCTKVKRFSRKDALLRHLRVVHQGAAVVTSNCGY